MQVLQLALPGSVSSAALSEIRQTEKHVNVRAEGTLHKGIPNTLQYLTIKVFLSHFIN